MKQTHMLIAAALAVGFLIGRAHAAKASTAPTAHNDVKVEADWWTYAGAWV
jgi:hypothetical protein